MATLLFDFKIQGIDRAIRSENDLRAAIKESNEELKKLEIGSEAYNDLNKSIAGARQVLKSTRQEQRDLQKEFEATSNAVRPYRQLSA